MGYLSDKLQIQLSELTKDSASATLVQKKISDDLIITCMKAIDRCEFARYAPSAPGLSQEEIYTTAADVIAKLEGALKWKVFVILVLFVIAVLCLQIVIQQRKNLTKVQSFINKVNIKNAAKCFDEILDNGYSSVEVFYNLGNCYFKSGSLAQSILNYERGQTASSDDEDVEFNLNVAQLKAVDKIEPLPRVFVLQCGITCRAHIHQHMGVLLSYSSGFAWEVSCYLYFLAPDI